jgi:hypothetical protein
MQNAAINQFKNQQVDEKHASLNVRKSRIVKKYKYTGRKPPKILEREKCKIIKS